VDHIDLRKEGKERRNEPLPEYKKEVWEIGWTKRGKVEWVKMMEVKEDKR